MKTAPPSILHLTESLARLGGVELFVNDWVRSDANSSAATLLDSQQRLDNCGEKSGFAPTVSIR